MWSSKPTIIVKCVAENKYSWYLYLSNNKKRPTCTSPATYKDAFRCRAAAKRFAGKFRGPMRIVDKVNKTDELLQEVILIDETKNMVNEDDFEGNEG
jgi:hypothetical protein